MSIRYTGGFRISEWRHLGLVKMATAAQVMVERCSKHPIEEKDIHCYDCNVDTCEICIQTPEHAKHRWGIKSKLIRRKRAEVIRSFEESGNKISELKTRMKDAEDKTRQQTSMYDLEMDKIKRKQASLVSQIEGTGTELWKACDIRKNRRTTFFQNISMKFSFLLHEYENLYAKYDEQKTKASDEEIAEYGRQLEDIIKRIEGFGGDELKSENVAFIESSVKMETEKLFGRLKITSQNIKANKKCTFNFRKGRISCIFPTRDGALLRNHMGTCIMQVGSDGTEKVRYETSKCISTFVVVEDYIIYTDYSQKIIGRIYPDGKEEVIALSAPVGVTGLCLDLENPRAFYVCLCDVTTVTPKESVERSVRRMSLSGDTIEKIEYNHHGKKMFNHPYRVCQNYNTNLCVVDRTKWDTGVVNVLQTNGDLLFVYRGLNSPLPFNPCGVACDKTCRIFISDCKNSTVHVLDENGNFLKYLFKKDSGVESPWALAVHDDTLWVGNEKSVVTTYELEENW